MVFGWRRCPYALPSAIAKLGSSPFGRVVGQLRALDLVVHRLGDVRRVVAHPLDVLGDEQEVRAAA